MRYLIYTLLFLSFSLSARGISVSGTLTQEHTVSPGQRIEGVIKISNGSTIPQIAKVTLTDFPFSKETVGEEERSNANWVQLSQKNATISPKSIYEYKYFIDVPKDENLVGTYNCVMIVSPDLEALNPIEFKGKAAIRSVVRYAINLITHIDDTGEYKLKLVEKDISVEPDHFAYSLKIENTGNRCLRPLASISLFDKLGNKVLDKKFLQYWIFPGATRKYDLDISDLPKGKYKGMLILDQKGSDFFAVRCNLKITRSMRLKAYRAGLKHLDSFKDVPSQYREEIVSYFENPMQMPRLILERHVDPEILEEQPSLDATEEIFITDLETAQEEDLLIPEEPVNEE